MTVDHVGAYIIRNNDQRLKFKGIVCDHCDTKIFTKRPVCLNCGEKTFKDFQVSPSGNIYHQAEAISLPMEASMSSK